MQSIVICQHGMAASLEIRLVNTSHRVRTHVGDAIATMGRSFVRLVNLACGFHKDARSVAPHATDWSQTQTQRTVVEVV